MTKKIFKSIILATGSVLIAAVVIIMGFLYEYFGQIQEEQLHDQLEIAATAVEHGGEKALEQIHSDRYRLTLVAEDGTVLYDTKSDAAALENHAQRAEIREAQQNGEATSVRYSSTLLQKTMYSAKRLSDRSVLRVSVSRATVWVLALGMLQPILIVVAVALILSGFLAKRLSRNIVEPINALDLEHPLENDTYEELSVLLNRINSQHRQIYEQMQEIRTQSEEFALITDSMQEALVLLDSRGMVFYINRAAANLFHVTKDCVGKDFLTVERTPEVTAAIHRAMEKNHSEIRLERNGKIWQFDISRIDSDNENIGTVILAMDNTEKERAEQNRREFTANVSHELKTPLQGIIGSAELLENGMVKPEDEKRFIGHIRSEAGRLLTLIEDIIRLSQLDEGMVQPKETVDLYSLAQQAVKDLTDAAKAKKVNVELTGNSAPISGVRNLLYEVICNLCDNAIKYNREGGRVSVSVNGGEQGSSVCVSDTGIGISPEYQQRIFERFYRVDKSHSKASGGTGLGLSIVKHAVALHSGTISLQSEPGKGTTIRVSFPKNGGGPTENPKN